LIHAATMVTAGVYMVARCGALYALAPPAQTVVAVIGMATALLAASIGLAQFDIKRVLAYSTVSQLGYMFVGVGVGAYSAGIFHLVTHAFFKALLFLGAGAVIHALHDQQDLRKMGGLKAKLPITYWTMLIATLAISGLPPFSGFFSKDAILAAAFEHAPLLWALGTLTAALTSFYMFRLLFLTFHGESRDPHAFEHAHEAPPVMSRPLILLAAGAALSGALGVPEFLGGSNRFAAFLAPVVGAPEQHLSHAAEFGLTGMAIAAALLGWWLAWARYGRRPDPIAGEEQGGVRQLLIHKYYVDEAYERLFVRPTFALARGLWRGMDVAVIDGGVNGIALLLGAVGRGLGRLQTGRVPVYITILLLGTVFLLWAWVGRWVF
jgi:NADH-quinone oxidoreductase subunit L